MYMVTIPALVVMSDDVVGLLAVTVEMLVVTSELVMRVLTTVSLLVQPPDGAVDNRMESVVVSVVVISVTFTSPSVAVAVALTNDIHTAAQNTTCRRNEQFDRKSTEYNNFG